MLRIPAANVKNRRTNYFGFGKKKKRSVKKKRHYQKQKGGFYYWFKVFKDAAKN